MLGPAARRLRRQHAAVLQNCKFARMMVRTWSSFVCFLLIFKELSLTLSSIVCPRLSSASANGGSARLYPPAGRGGGVQPCSKEG